MPEVVDVGANVVLRAVAVPPRVSLCIARAHAAAAAAVPVAPARRQARVSRPTGGNHAFLIKIHSDV